MIANKTDVTEEQAVELKDIEVEVGRSLGINRIAHLVSNRASDGELDQTAPNILKFVSPKNTSPSEQVRSFARDLRDALGQFIETGIELPPSEMGFTAPSVDGLDITGLKECLYETSRSLEGFFRDNRDQSPEGISMRSLAQGLQGAIDSFRVMLTRAGFSGEIPRSHESMVIEASIEFKQEVSNVMQQVDAFVLQMAMSEREQAG